MKMWAQSFARSGASLAKRSPVSWCICRSLSHMSPNLTPILDEPFSNRHNPSFVQITTERRLQGWVPDRAMGYKKRLEDVTYKQHVLDGLKMFKQELVLWREEWREKLDSDPVLIYRPGETDVLFSFGDNDVDITKFVVTSDSDNNEGKSNCTFERSPAGYAVFKGHLDSSVPEDGQIKRAGYCNIKSKRVKKSFQRYTWYDWSAYNTLVLRVRGDGRPYMINLTTDGIFDITWLDMYQYALYTRGGPHWQVMRIPFSKFFFSIRGRVQDKQSQIPLNRVSSLGITAAGRVLMDGPFNLEIDYIGLEYDPLHEEDFAYEMYQVSPYIVGL